MIAISRLVRHPLAGIAASACILTGILGYMALDRIWLVKTAGEIVLPIKAVDPRDIFKGDYARIGYDISMPDINLIAQDLKQGHRARKVFVTLERGAGDVWRPVAVGSGRPTGIAGNQVVLAGRMSNASTRPQITYGIERFFVPEGTGDKLEALVASSTVSAIVAVDGAGRAAIKGFMHDGQRIYEEPLL